jgi:hypothetical protein
LGSSRWVSSKTASVANLKNTDGASAPRAAQFLSTQKGQKCGLTGELKIGNWRFAINCVRFQRWIGKTSRRVARRARRKGKGISTTDQTDLTDGILFIGRSGIKRNGVGNVTSWGRRNLMGSHLNIKHLKLVSALSYKRKKVRCSLASSRRAAIHTTIGWPSHEENETIAGKTVKRNVLCLNTTPFSAPSRRAIGIFR